MSGCNESYLQEPNEPLYVTQYVPDGLSSKGLGYLLFVSTPNPVTTNVHYSGLQTDFLIELSEIDKQIEHGGLVALLAPALIQESDGIFVDSDSNIWIADY